MSTRRQPSLAPLQAPFWPGSRTVGVYEGGFAEFTVTEQPWGELASIGGMNPMTVELAWSGNVLAAITVGDHPFQGTRVWYTEVGDHFVNFITEAWERPNGWISAALSSHTAAAQNAMWTTFEENLNATYFSGKGAIGLMFEEWTKSMPNPNAWRFK